MKLASILVILSIFYYEQVRGQSTADTSFKSYQQMIPGTALKFSMVPVPAGKFMMGSPANATIKEADEQPAHTVVINAFWMGAYEVTYPEYDAFAKDENISFNSQADGMTRPSQPYIEMTLGMGNTAGFPANSMQQFGAIMYCRWLYLKTNIFYRLPTEAEWEYACRAGSTTAYPFGDNAKELDDYAWYAGNSGGRYHKTGELKPNAWGLYDMLGNVAEWMLDQYDEDFYSTSVDSISPVRLPTTKHPRTVRGGHYNDQPDGLRSADRVKSEPSWNRRDPQIPKSRWWNVDAPFVGFRIIRPVQQPTQEEAAAFFKLYLGK
ncbi:SUMF1/EgtB/PvdO family nonheme iron enzyme [Chitinophaga sp. MM2321]|uniref:formylglycine-generating enzyme family protein n=1 Tax=Chitinophaga sp. MM2321 TaxID=3137178 RepID=UPI0032D5983A